MKTAIFGTGAVGGYFGGKLAEAGHDVSFIARGSHLQAIQSNGLKVNSINGNFSIHPAQATDKPETIGVVDLILCSVKSWQVTEITNVPASRYRLDAKRCYGRKTVGIA